MTRQLRLTGIGLRKAHEQEILQQLPAIAWLEVHSENYFIEGGAALHQLMQIAQHYPLSFHGVGLSIGSTDELNWQHLKKLRDVIRSIKPALVSDHLAWSSLHGQYFHDLLPLPYTLECLSHITERVLKVQDYLQQPLLLENITHYVQFHASQIPEYEFFNELVARTGCQLLLDINNLYVSASHLDFDPQLYLEKINAKAIAEYHLAGYSYHNKRLIDTHSALISDEVWHLFATAVKHLGAKPTIIEWDQHLPALAVLIAQAERAETIMREIYAPQPTC